MCVNYGDKSVKMGDAARLCVQIRELCEWQDRCEWTFLKKV